jgi:hypothetical protein
MENLLIIALAAILLVAMPFVMWLRSHILMSGTISARRFVQS